MEKVQISKKIVLTGGHAATTALATIERLKFDKNTNWDIYWVGTSRAMEGSLVKTLEFQIFPQYGVKCVDIVSGRVQRKLTRHSLASFVRIPFGLLHAFVILLKIRPIIVVSYGGFAAFPVVVAGWVLRIPVILHEQTVAVGLSNQLSAPFAKIVTLARSSSKKYFANSKTFVIGNPLMSKILEVSPKKSLPKIPVVFITGGSRGSHVINEVVFEALPKLLSKYRIIHQTGGLDIEKAEGVKKLLSSKDQERYTCYASVPPLEISEIYKKADIIAGRAGANTIAEIAACGRAAVLIPIPWTRYNEQHKNAIAAQKAGFAIILEQDNLNAKTLEEFLDKIQQNWSKMRQLTESEFEIDKKAAEELVKLITIHAK